MQAFIPATPFLLTSHPLPLRRSRTCHHRVVHTLPHRGAQRMQPTCATPNPPPPTPTPDAPPVQESAAASSNQEGSSSSREVPFEIRGFSLANVGLLLGATITLYSFSSYFGSNATASATSLGFVYGVPILLIGCALKYAELPPVPVRSPAEASALRDAKGTDVQKKVYSDITRHRYGDEAHLSAAMASLGLVPRGEACPELVEAEERVADGGEYCLRLVFYSVATPWSEWQAKRGKYDAFFGPGVRTELEKVDSEKRLVALSLISSGEKEDKGKETE